MGLSKEDFNESNRVHLPVGGGFGKVLREVDNSNGFKGALLYANAASNAQLL